jgi:hypothetical protein
MLLTKAEPLKSRQKQYKSSTKAVQKQYKSSTKAAHCHTHVERKDLFQYGSKVGIARALLK